MAGKEILVELTRHAEWADAEMWRAVLDAAGKGPAALDSKVEFWLHHIHVVQHAFVYIWRGEPLVFPEIGDFAEPLALADWGREGHASIQGYLDQAGGADLDRELEIPWTEQLKARWNRPIGPVSVAQSATQVAMHSTHHRGQVAARLRELDVEPPMIDYIAWVWFGKPEAEWPEGGAKTS